MRAQSSFVAALAACALVALLVGCSGSGEVVKLDIRALPSDEAGMQSAGLSQRPTIRIEPFEDERPNRDNLGVRTHLGGGTTVFRAAGGPATEVTAKVLAEYLSQRGLEASVGTNTQQADVVISGRLTEFGVRAKSRFFSTLLTTSLKLGLRAENTADGSATTMSLEDEREDAVFWFEPSDLEELANEMLQESVANMLAGVRVENGVFRMK